MSDSKEDNHQSVLEKVQEFCLSNELEAEFESFAKEHADSFMTHYDSKASDSEEHPLAFHDIYRQYLNKFEGRIERFLNENGYSPNDFYSECKTIIDEDEIYGAKRFFVEALLAVAEYENFLTLMQGEMYSRKAKINAEKAAAQSHK